MDDCIEGIFPHSFVGLSLIDLETGEEVVQHNSNKLFSPASTIKVATAIFALKRLGSSYQFTTALYKKGHDIYVYFSGDPNLRLRNVERLFEKFKDVYGLNIQGDIYIVEPSWPFAPHSETWAVEDTHFCYGTAVRPFTVNENAYRFHYKNQGKGKEPQPVDHTHPLGFHVVHEVVTAFCPEGVADENCALDRKDDLYGTRIFGHMPHTLKELNLCLPLLNKERFADGVVRTALYRTQLSFNGRISFADAVPAGAQKVEVERSLPMRALLQEMLETSNNLFADIIFLTTALDVDPNVKTWRRAAQGMQSYLQDVYGVELENSCFLDGSGIGRPALIMPQQMSKLLKEVYNDKYIFDALKTMFTVPGGRGFPKGKFMHFNNSLWIKRGSMNGIFNMTGYVQDGSGRLYALTLLINHFLEQPSDQYNKVERLLKTIIP